MGGAQPGRPQCSPPPPRPLQYTWQWGEPPRACSRQLSQLGAGGVVTGGCWWPEGCGVHRGLPSCGFLLGASIPKPLLPPPCPRASVSPPAQETLMGAAVTWGSFGRGTQRLPAPGATQNPPFALCRCSLRARTPPHPWPPPQAFAQELREQILNIDPASPGTILAASPSASRWALSPAPSLLNPRSRSAPPGPGSLGGGGRGEIWGSPSSSQQLAQPGFGFASTQGFGSFTLLPLLAPCGPKSRDRRGVGHGPPPRLPQVLCGGPAGVCRGDSGCAGV